MTRGTENMQNLPTADIYQKEVKYMPWGILILEIEEFIMKNVPKNGSVLDLLCGTGYLLGELQKKRPDIKFIGVDLEKEFIDYASKQYPEIEFQVGNVLTWKTNQKFDAVLCTGGLHHLPYEKQKDFIQKISSLATNDGFVVVADPYIDSYSTESGRKIAAAKLGYEYLVATIKNGAPDDVIKATASLIENDVFLIEFKDSIAKVEHYFKEYFSVVDKHKTWPEIQSEYGDYYFILRK